MMKKFYGNFHPVVEDVQQNASRESGKRVLGAHPENNKEISVRLGKFGPMVQIGTVDDDEKPKFASLPQDLQIESVTLDEALSLLDSFLPSIVWIKGICAKFGTLQPIAS